jgi:ribosome maturation factor RimP
MSARAMLLDALAPALQDLGVDLEDVEVVKAGRRHVVRVVVDRDGGVDLDLVATVSRCVSDLMETPELDAAVPGAYVLEVTSPGVDRPLTQPAHWRRATDRLVSVTTESGDEFVGRIESVPDEDTIVMNVDGESRTLKRADVSHAIVQVEFNRDSARAEEEPASADADDDEAPDDEKGEM